MNDPADTPSSDDEHDVRIDGFPSVAAGEGGRDPFELLLTEFVDLQREGEYPDIEAYARRHPDLADRIREFFPMVAAMEGWKNRKESDILREQISQDIQFDKVGDCEIVSKVGSGGMGVVYHGVHQKSRERVAVKLLPSRLTKGSTFRRRFVREAKTASRLKHRNIVPVLEFGEQDGYCYYVMPFVEGVSLEWLIKRLRETGGVVYADEIAAVHPSAGDDAEETTTDAESQRRLRRDAWSQYVRILLQVADALKYAHQQGTIHRDIKPANLLLDKDGRAWVTDFGLAVSSNDQSDTEIGMASGTLRYMAPERFRGQCDARSDVYGLGMTLYELLTLEPAFEANSRTSLVESVESHEIVSPRTKRPHIPEDLDAIAMKAIAEDPEARYQSAGDFAADLLRYHHGHAVLARPKRGWGIASWFRRRTR